MPIITGLELSKDDVKIVQLKKARRVELVNFGWFRLPDGEERPGFVGELKKALSGYRIKNTRLRTFIPRHSATTRFLKLPTADPREIRRMLAFEAEKQLPFPLDKVEFDFYPINHPQPDTSEILLVAVQKEVISRHLSLLQELDLAPEAIELSSFSLCRAVHFNIETGETLALLDLDEGMAEICILSKGRLRWTRSIPQSFNRLKDGLARELGIGSKEAEKILKGFTIIKDKVDDPTQAGKVIDDWINSIIEEIKLSLEAYLKQQDGESVKGIILGGEALALKGICDLLAQRSGMGVCPIDPFSRIEHPRFASQVFEPGALLKVTGLALGGFTHNDRVDLIPEALRRKKEKVSKRKALSFSILIFGLIIGFGFLASSQHLRAKERRLLGINQKLEEIRPGLGAAMDFRAKQKIWQEFWEGDKGGLDILREISLILPEGVLLKGFLFEKGKEVVLSGQAGSFEMLAEAVSLLGKSPYFERITPKSSRREGDVICFEIRAGLKRVESRE